MLDTLKLHPRNYREHPEDQLAHLVESLKEHGVYRNIVIAKDGTILAGHGVYTAAAKLGLKEIPVIRLDVDANDPRALKLLVGDNEIEHLAEQNDRLLTELLKSIKNEADQGLLGTGYDEMMLANFIMVTRPESEIKDINEAEAWVGMPEFAGLENVIKTVVCFDNEKAKADFAERLGLDVAKITRSMWWPWREQKDDVRHVRFQDSDGKNPS